MADDVERALGAPEIAGTLVNAGTIPDVPSFGRVGYVAVSGSEVAVLNTTTGWKVTPTDEALARFSRGELVAAELEEGPLLSRLRLEFRDGRRWEFDIPSSDKKTARAVVRALNDVP
jgi:hypothetical protein